MHDLDNDWMLMKILNKIFINAEKSEQNNSLFSFLKDQHSTAKKSIKNKEQTKL